MSSPDTFAIDLLQAATTTGDGTTYDHVKPFFAAALQLEFTGSPTQVVVNLMGLLNGTTFDTLAVLDTAAGYLSGEIVSLQLPVLARKVKCNIGTLTGGNVPTVTAHFVGRE